MDIHALSLRIATAQPGAIIKITEEESRYLNSPLTYTDQSAEIERFKKRNK